MYNHNKAQQSKNRVHISWDILYTPWWNGSNFFRDYCRDLLSRLENDFIHFVFISNGVMGKLKIIYTYKPFGYNELRNRGTDHYILFHLQESRNITVTS